MVVVVMDTCMHLEVEVKGRSTAAVPVVGGMVECFFPPVVVLEEHQCHFAGPGVVVSGLASACPGSLISSFSVYRVNLVKSLNGFAQRCWLPKYWQCLRSHHLRSRKL